MLKIKQKVSLLTIVACTLLCFLIGCTTTNSKDQSNDVYGRVLKSGVIKVGYLPYPPGLIKDPNSQQLSGIFHDVLVKVGGNLDLKVEFTEEVAWGSMIEALKTGRVDIICTAVWPTSQRGKQADFTHPLYYSPVKAYVAAGNNKFDGSISAINDNTTTIATMDGEMTSIIAKSDFAKAKTNSLTQSSDVSQLLLEVADGKADVTFVEPVIANDFMKHNPGKIKEVANAGPIRVFPNVMMVDKSQAAFLSMINTSLDELQNTGYVSAIIAKYEPYPNSFYRLSPPYQIK